MKILKIINDNIKLHPLKWFIFGIIIGMIISLILNHYFGFRIPIDENGAFVG